MINMWIALENLLLVILCTIVYFLSAHNTKLIHEKTELEVEIQKRKSFIAHQYEVIQRQAANQSNEANEKVQLEKIYSQRAAQTAEEAKLIQEKNNILEQRVNQLQSELYRARQKAKRIGYKK